MRNLLFVYLITKNFAYDDASNQNSNTFKISKYFIEFCVFELER